MRIIIGADLIPTSDNEKYFINGDVKAILGEKMLAILDNADYRIFNLETALSDKDTPIIKGGPNIRAATSSINGYRKMKVDLLGIANNHVLDHGYEGFVSTIKTLDENGIAHVGAGFTKEEACSPYIFEKEGKKIGVYACCEHEFSWISDYGFGSNGFDALESLDEIAELKSKVDYLIVLYHGGKEHYRYPSPYLRKVTRKIISSGADIVICQHTHCVGASEDYKGGKIIFGQGNFVFAQDMPDFEDTWNEGIAVAIDINNDGVSYEYIPYVMTKTGIEYNNDKNIVEDFNARSEEIKQEGFIEEKFEEMAERTVFLRYIQHMKVNEMDENDIPISLFHYAECEVHRECLITGIRKKLRLGRFGENEVK